MSTLPAWKEEVNAKLNEHRSRRHLSPEHQGRLAEMEPSFAVRPSEQAASRIAARVAERYARVPSYREMLEQQAASTPARLISRETEALPAPEIAAPVQKAEPRAPEAILPEPSLFESEPVQADAVTRQVREPRARVSRWAEFAPPAAPEPVQEPEFFAAFAAAEAVAEPVAAFPQADLLPLEAEIAASAFANPEVFAEEATLFVAEPEAVQESAEEESNRLLLEELAAVPVEPALPLPARIIEFPRELVAPRKARPRQERGPEDNIEEEQSQLRIFEVEPAAAAPATMGIETEVAQASAAPAIPPPSAPNWNTIRLDEEPVPKPVGFFDSLPVAAERSSLLLDPPIYTANLEDRIMAGIVDVCIVGAGFLMFVSAFVTYTSHLPTGKAGLIAGAAALLGLVVAYQFLFLTLGEATPGMRYAKIALCTFDDENPTRGAMRARIGAILLSALPLGLGFLWSIFDEDRLGWHDRITRTYQRSYRED